MTEPCGMREIINEMQTTVRKHDRELGEVGATMLGISRDVSYIRERVDDGLAKTVARIDKDLASSIEKGKTDAAQVKADVAFSAAEVKADAALAASDLRGENWLGRIVTGSVGKLIGVAVIFIIVNTVASNGVLLLLKEKYSLETPGQQRGIAQKTTDIQSTLNVYHTHTLLNGNVLSHTGDVNTPAWLLVVKTNSWEKAPTMRTEIGIK